jgi:hypothetical protein
MGGDIASIRRQLAILARRKAARTLGWPRDWRPSEVTNPLDEQPFTPAGVWDYIAQVLEANPEIPIEAMTLDNPKGATGYVMSVRMGEHSLYIKLQLGAGKIIGRSFHYSIHEQTHEQPRKA